MSWTAPGTAVTGAVITAGFWNTNGRDNLTDLDRRATILTNTVAAAETTTSTSYTSLFTAGPGVSVNIGPNVSRCLIAIYAAISNSSNFTTFMAYTYDLLGSTFVFDSQAISTVQVAGATTVRLGATFVLNGVAGSGIVPIGSRYRVNGGTGTFSDRMVSAAPLAA